MNPSWGYDRIVGALGNLGYQLSDQTVGNILRRHGVPPAPQRKHAVTWQDFIRAHLDVLAGTDFFTAEVLTLKGVVTYYVLFFIHLESRRVCLAGVTRHPDQEWMEQQARNVTVEEWGFLTKHKYLLHDRDRKFCPSFRQLIETGGGKSILLPAMSPNLNAYAERWLRSTKEECLFVLLPNGAGPVYNDSVYQRHERLKVFGVRSLLAVVPVALVGGGIGRGIAIAGTIVLFFIWIGTGIKPWG